jgi:DNA helicase-2/ATP-dependent DNA helicase PcrA
LAFYKLLIDNDSKNNYRFSSGTMDFLEKFNGNYKRCNVLVSELDVQMVKEQLSDCNTRLFQHDFTGCGEDNCKWCNFVSESQALPTPLAEGIEEEMI